MKKWMITILILLILLVGSVYLFIPNIISINQNISINANHEGLQRALIDERSWAKWWPEGAATNKTGSSNSFIYNGHTYAITGKGISSLPISIRKKDIVAVSTLIPIQKKVDTAKLTWEARIPTSYNPLKRLQVYLGVRELSNDMRTLLQKMQLFYSKTENVYGYDIRKEFVVDSTLISTFNTSQGYPDVGFIYGLIDELRKYIASHSATETGFPMLNISTMDGMSFITRVAIPVNKKLPSSGNISYKWMLSGGNILITEVKGGPASVNEAFRQVEEYVKDFQRMTPAIHFLSLVTDRRQEPDTSKWITRIYYPVN